MRKTILLTGATDGIGLETAKMLAPMGHTLLLHGRNQDKLAKVLNITTTLKGAGDISSYLADLSSLREVGELADAIIRDHEVVDILINNAGVFNTPEVPARDGLDPRFVVNTIAPYLLTQKLLPLMPADGRVVNLSSAAQSPVNLDALAGRINLGSASAYYAQSKLAITMWSRALAISGNNSGPAFIAVNPRSLLGSKMVKEAFGVAGGDLKIGAEIVCRAALADEFRSASGKYFDNDSGEFSSPHPDALDLKKCAAVVETIENILHEKQF